MQTKRLFNTRFVFFLPAALFFFLFFTLPGISNSNIQVSKSDSLTGNNYCLQCHGQMYYGLKSPESGKVHRKMMSLNCIIDTSVFKKSNHRKFQCTSCHSDDFKKFPHSEKALMEEIGSCVECHSGDSVATAYKFDLIDIDFQKSVHVTKHAENFTCWACHEAHSYKVKATTVEYDNSMCLSCHANTKKYNLILNKNNPNILEKHDWLPNQQTHFQNVRCIECHARVNDSILVAHNIQPKEKAVKRCVECHSTNSLLQQTLYKYQHKEQISRNGYFNAAILNKSYVIGANRNYYLNVASIVILLIVLGGIAIHTFLRIKLKK
jgi:predicted CXXCH cytochrome family protein